jgi:hypothetical protein
LFLQQEEAFRSEVLPWEQLRDKLADGGYRAIDRSEFGELMRHSEKRSVGSPQRPWIRRAEYQAGSAGPPAAGGGSGAAAVCAEAWSLG